MAIPSEFCPADCLTYQDGGHELICRDCCHQQDVKLDKPYPILLRNTAMGKEIEPEKATVVGTTGGDRLIINTKGHISVISRRAPFIK